jgi:predicted dehydrogenase
MHLQGIDDSMTVSVGVVGAGDIARKMHLPVLLSMPEVRVDWLCDRSAERAWGLGSAYGVRGIEAGEPASLPPCDVVLLAIPVEAREPYLQALCETRAAVLCEKPFALSAAQHLRITERYDPSRLGCGYMRRFYDSTSILRHVIAEGWFGRVLRLRIAEGNRSRGSGSDLSFLDGPGQTTARGALTDLGSHSIDLALYITRARSFRVHECEMVLDGYVDRRASARVDLLCDTAAGSDTTVELDYCVSWLDAQPNRLELQCERATLFCGLGWDADVFVGLPERPSQAYRLSPPLRGARTPNQAFCLEWRAFLDGFERRQESAISANSAYLTTALVEALHERGRSHD